MIFSIADENIKVAISEMSRVSFSDGTFDPKLWAFRDLNFREHSADIVYNFNSNPSWSRQKDLVEIKTGFPNWKVKVGKSGFVYEYESEEDSRFPYKATVHQGRTMPSISIDVVGLTPAQFGKANFQALSLCGTDQVVLGRLLLYRHGALLHGNCVKIGNKTLLILGDSNSGKSTLSAMLERAGAQWLTDDRTIIRYYGGGRIAAFGSWLHGSHKIINDSKNWLDGVLILEKSKKNSIGEVRDPAIRKDVLISSIIKIVLTGNEWESLLNTVLALRGLPFKVLNFNLETGGEEQYDLLNKETF